MRRYRVGLIQTAEQLRFSYQSIIEGAETLGIDLRSVVTSASYNNDDESSDDDDSDDDSDDSDGSNSAEEVEEEDDVVSVDSPFHSHINHFPVGEVILANVEAGAMSNDGPEEPPPPIPPRGESLVSSPGTLILKRFLLYFLLTIFLFYFISQIMTGPCRWFHRDQKEGTKRWKLPPRQIQKPRTKRRMK